MNTEEQALLLERYTYKPYWLLKWDVSDHRRLSEDAIRYICTYLPNYAKMANRIRRSYLRFDRVFPVMTEEVYNAIVLNLPDVPGGPQPHTMVRSSSVTLPQLMRSSSMGGVYWCCPWKHGYAIHFGEQRMDRMAVSQSLWRNKLHAYRHVLPDWVRPLVRNMLEGAAQRNRREERWERMNQVRQIEEFEGLRMEPWEVEAALRVMV